MLTPASVPEHIYKIASREVFDASIARGHFLGMPIDLKDGYVHFSTAEQLAETLRLHFAGQDNLELFSVATAPLGDKLVWEPSRGGQLFPHLYAELPMSAVGERAVASVAADGSVTLPEWVK